MNQIISEVYASSKPEVGTPATFMGYSDRNPGTVARVISPKQIVVIPCTYKAVGGPYNYGDDIEYEYFPQTNDELQKLSDDLNLHQERIYTLRKNGKWVMKGCDMNQGMSVLIGTRGKYYDPHF